MAENPIALRWQMTRLSAKPMLILCGVLGLAGGVVNTKDALSDMTTYHRLAPHIAYLQERWVEDLPSEQIAVRNQAILGLFEGNLEAVKIAKYYREEQIKYVNRYGSDPYSRLEEASAGMKGKSALGLAFLAVGITALCRGVKR